MGQLKGKRSPYSSNSSLGYSLTTFNSRFVFNFRSFYFRSFRFRSSFREKLAITELPAPEDCLLRNAKSHDDRRKLETRQTTRVYPESVLEVRNSESSLSMISAIQGKLWNSLYHPCGSSLRLAARFVRSFARTLVPSFPSLVMNSFASSPCRLILPLLCWLHQWISFLPC